METKKLKKVLISLDLDPTAQKVAEIGYALAKTMGAEIILLHVTTYALYYSSTEHTPIMGFSVLGPWKLLENDDDLIIMAQEFLNKTKEHLGDENIKTILKEGNLANAIITAANDLHADVIVMGSHSRRWLENIVLGSTTEKVLHDSTIPVFIVPTGRKK